MVYRIICLTNFETYRAEPTLASHCSTDIPYFKLSFCQGNYHYFISSRQTECFSQTYDTGSETDNCIVFVAILFCKYDDSRQCDVHHTSVSWSHLLLWMCLPTG